MLHGIDVSYHQKAIDWKKVKQSGIDFAIIRAGYGKSTVDKTFIKNIEGCIANNIPVGVYWFIYGVNESEAIRNADMCHSVIAPYKDKITVKVWCDFEYDTDKNANGRGVIFNKEMRTKMVIAFCERIKYYGYDVGNYANPDYLKNKFNDLSQYPLWLARYSESKGNYRPYIWQYTSSGKVDGISGRVDMNYGYFELGEKPTEYYDKPEITLVEALNDIGVTATYDFRKKIAAANGIKDYKGTAEQNMKLLELLNNGKLIKA